LESKPLDLEVFFSFPRAGVGMQFRRASVAASTGSHAGAWEPENAGAWEPEKFL